MGFCDGGDGAGELPLEIAEIAGVCGLVQSKWEGGRELTRHIAKSLPCRCKLPRNLVLEV